MERFTAVRPGVPVSLLSSALARGEGGSKHLRGQEYHPYP